MNGSRLSIVLNAAIIVLLSVLVLEAAGVQCDACNVMSAARRSNTISNHRFHVWLTSFGKIQRTAGGFLSERPGPAQPAAALSDIAFSRGKVARAPWPNGTPLSTNRACGKPPGSFHSMELAS